MSHLALCFTGTIVYLAVLQSESCETFRNVNDSIECVLLATMIAAAIWVIYF